MQNEITTKRHRGRAPIYETDDIESRRDLTQVKYRLTRLLQKEPILTEKVLWQLGFARRGELSYAR
jgi:hypothetical protein